MNFLWLRAATSVALILVVAGILRAVFGPPWGLLIVSLGLVAMVSHHVVNLARLERWMRQPLGTPVPHGSGVWEYIFSGLNRRARMALDQRQQLADSLERFRTAAQAMPDGVIILNDQNLIEWVNTRAEEYFGLDDQRDRGVPVTNLLRRSDFAAYLARGRYDEPLSLQPEREDGRTLSIQIIPFGAEQKLVLARDITHLERLETMRRDFVANVSHELRTPLTVVSGFIETVADGLDEMDADETRRHLELALEQARRMQRLIDDLLTLSALETRGPPPEDERVSVRRLLAEVSDEAKALSAGRHRIEVEEQGADCALLGAAPELHSAFSNLVSNAVRYTPAGGSIRIRWHRDGQGASFTVEDTGVGIEARHIPRLTERFYRVDRGRSRESGGTGLGLAIVKHVLTRHHAHLEIASEPGRGSRFCARFPADRVVAEPILERS
ncbi:MAG: phosphate regulon sensor histidine kinase PhoR [Pseudomonadota bacterium]